MSYEVNVGEPTWTAEEFKNAYTQPIFKISENIMAVYTGLDALVEFRPSRLAPSMSFMLNEIMELDRRTQELRAKISKLFTSPPAVDKDAKSDDA